MFVEVMPDTKDKIVVFIPASMVGTSIQIPKKLFKM